jgi:hypothetical protein
VVSRPSKRTLPDVGSINCATMRPIVVLPLPDSPTSPITLPRGSSNGTSSTARTTGPRPKAAGAKCLLRR